MSGKKYIPDYPGAGIPPPPTPFFQAMRDFRLTSGSLSSMVSPNNTIIYEGLMPYIPASGSPTQRQMSLYSPTVDSDVTAITGVGFSTQTITHTFSSLMPRSRIQIADNLWRVKVPRKNKATAKIVAAFTVPTSGSVTVHNLRDSIYSVLYNDIRYVKYNQYKVSIGNPDLFNTISSFPSPPPPVITGISAYLQGDIAEIEVSWSPASSGEIGIYKVYYKKTSDATWSLHQTINDRRNRISIINPLDYSTPYDVKIQTLTADGRNLGYSGVSTVSTPEDPTIPIMPNLIKDGSYEDSIT